MTFRVSGVLGVALAWFFLLGPLGATELLAQGADDKALEAFEKVRPGGYLSILKLGLVAGVFLVWVAIADWINRDAMKFGKKSGLVPEFWNPMVVLPFLVLFVAVISVPYFWYTFPVYALGAVVPPLTYMLTRRKRMKDDQSLKRAVLKSKGKEDKIEIEVLPQDEGANVTFSAAGADETEEQGNLLRARQTGGFMSLKNMIFDAQFKRADQILLDYTQTAANIRILVDGTWHALPSMDRESGDAMLASLKCLAGLNPQERRAKQSGQIGVKSEHGKGKVDITSQGVPTGERVSVRFAGNAQEARPLDQLGMLPEMYQRVRESLNGPGVTIISAPPGQGFTASWQGALLSGDRLTRDCIGFVNREETETDIENIVQKYYETDGSQTQLQALKTILLTQPDMLAVPKVEDKETMDHLVLQANQQERSILFRTPANSAAEALVRIYAQAGDRNEFLRALQVVTCQRLLRRLCPTCRAEIRVQPQMIQKLGGDPRAQKTLFNPYQPPPPEQRVDEKGNPIEIPPCETCGGIGYIGRIAVFELLEVGEQLREFIKKNPQPQAIEAAAVKLGKKTLAQEAYKLVLLGVTSLAEVQRVLNQQKK